jgi:lincosamide nucleotidyltransferase A/C/D/E
MSGRHIMTAASALGLLDALRQVEVEACVGGGWAVDALLGEQTREHSDLDLWVQAVDLDRLIRVVVERGVDRLLPWGGDRPWNFVLHDGSQLRVDLHLYEVLPGQEMLHYGGIGTGVTFPAEALAGTGRIAGRQVSCESAPWALTWRTGYAPRAVDLHDVGQLCRRFGFAVPEGYG